MLTKEYNVKKNDFVNAGKVSVEVKRLLKETGISPSTIRRIGIACYEAEINMIIHSLGGDITFNVEDDGKVTLSFDDVGPGIPDIERALVEGFSTASMEAKEMGFGAGMGLPNIKRVSDEFSISSSSEGTHLLIGFVEQ
ncbi:MAG: ATP-binding protein [Erysipelotrichaceae bacterium]|nr:ATP-binding protein [Erysipelotrichaceae bacterium]